MAKMPKGQKFGVRKTHGLDVMSYDLFEIVGLSLGKLNVINDSLGEHNTVLAREIRDVIQCVIDANPRQTISNE